MDSPGQTAARLLDTGILVGFRQGDVEVRTGRDEAQFAIRVEFTLGLGEEEDEDPAEGAALGFLFTPAALSFADARPRGAPEPDYIERDSLTVGDFIEGLRYERGRCDSPPIICAGAVSRPISRSDPTGPWSWRRGEPGKAALRWLDALRGKKLMQIV